MNKLLGLFLLALAFLAPQSAWAVNCFWVGGTGAWDSSSTAHWAPTTGGAATGCQTSNAAPAAGDAIIFDANTGGGTTTPDGTIAGIAFASLSASTATNTLAFNTNNPNVTFGTVNFSGSGARTINMGSGTWTITGIGGSTLFDVGTQTNCTSCVYANAALNFTGSGSSKLAALGTSLSFGNVTIANNAAKGVFQFTITTGTTLASLTVGSGTTVTATQGTTLTITGALAVTGTSSAPSGLQSAGAQASVATVSVGSASTGDWVSFLRVTRSGAGTLNATNCFDLGGNTSITSCNPPSGGGGGGRIIGG